MPRRQFIADLKQLRAESLPKGISCLIQGVDDGQIQFQVAAPGTELINITACITDLSDYPSSHEYIFFGDESLSIEIASFLGRLKGTNGKPLHEMLVLFSRSISVLFSITDGIRALSPPVSNDEYEEGSIETYESDPDIFEHAVASYEHVAQPNRDESGRIASTPFHTRIRHDLRALRNAGFRVSHHGHLLEGFRAYISAAVRMSRLGISEEAMQAWKVTAKDYLILLICYKDRYKTNEELSSLDSARSSLPVNFRICVSRRSKPTLQEAVQAFCQVRNQGWTHPAQGELSATNLRNEDDPLRPTFISEPLKTLLETRLVPILRLRSVGLSWRGAEDWLTHVSNNAQNEIAGVIPQNFFDIPETNTALPKIVTDDHFVGTRSEDISFPLVAMQFTLRHFVRCTSFCLVCHRQLDSDLEAIKPYVCDRGLCLYQYMTLGFGPNIEHEIVSQPKVVDLLISICYNAASHTCLKEFPDGLAITVPPMFMAIPRFTPDARPYAATIGKLSETKTVAGDTQTQTVSYDSSVNELLFDKSIRVCPVKRGQWVVLKPVQTRSNEETHCRVNETNFFPVVNLGPPIVLNARIKTMSTPSLGRTPQSEIKSPSLSTQKWSKFTLQIYDTRFEQLSPNSKCWAICQILDTLPSVSEMSRYISSTGSAQLVRWIDRISPAALSFLRWIIASNRACIMQMDGPGDANVDVAGPNVEKVSGMPNYTQFRFAMGAPDKEQRFISAVSETAERLQSEYPSIFAWHGSALHNWHSIIREGLHFKEIMNGRAYGDGVYHAKDATTSTHYSFRTYHCPSQNGRDRTQWPQSLLKVHTILALNEIVNAPREFQSQNPYLVVAQLDWIQTRFLFVGCHADSNDEADAASTSPYPQDPSFTPTGISGTPVIIPAISVKSRLPSKRVSSSQSGPGTLPPKRLKSMKHSRQSSQAVASSAEEDSPSDTEDEALLKQEDASVSQQSDNQVPIRQPNSSSIKVAHKLEFTKASSNLQGISRLPTPSYANSVTSRRLMKEMKSLEQLQQQSRLADLGWFIDFTQIDNVYQWIVELHSFDNIDSSLPLIGDMANRNVKSIVMELQFGENFPFTPPYARVIRPRFLPLMQGGGGHVVTGGAMCMELLTNSGWSLVSTMESVLMQIRLAIASHPPARLDMHATGDYSPGEAAEGYIRACNAHGWAIPPGFREMAYGIPLQSSPN